MNKQDYVLIDRVLNMEENNYQAKQLKDLINDRMRRGWLSCYSFVYNYYFVLKCFIDSLITAGGVGGAALVGPAAVSAGVLFVATGVSKDSLCMINHTYFHTR